VTTHPSRRRPTRLAVGALLLDAGASLPFAVTGAVSASLRDDLMLSDRELGASLAACFLAGALVALLAQRVLDRLGGLPSACLGVALCTAALLGIASASSARALLVWLLAAGAGLAVMMPASNLLLLKHGGVDRLAGLLAIKQASVPLAMLTAGLLVPLALAVATWRVLFLAATLAAPLGLVLLWSLPATAAPDRSVRPTRETTAGRIHSSRDRVPLGLTDAAIGVALTSCLPGALTAYLVLSLVDAGLSPATAALIYGGANLSGIVLRLSGGLYASRTATDGFRPVGLMMIVGGLGAGLLGTSQLWALILGASLAFGLGWGWPGLLFYAVMRARPSAPAAASAIVQSGGLAGAALGPFIAGAIVASYGWAAAWPAIGALAVTGGGLVLRAGSRIRSDRRGP